MMCLGRLVCRAKATGHEADTSIINGNANYFYLRFYHSAEQLGAPATKSGSLDKNIPTAYELTQKNRLR
jgi:hypothetical protein